VAPYENAPRLSIIYRILAKTALTRPSTVELSLDPPTGFLMSRS
jgi:hypothetical protein